MATAQVMLAFRCKVKYFLIVPNYGYNYFFALPDLSTIMAGQNNDKFLKEFGKNLKKLREAKGLSTRQFAYDADISHSSVGRLEAGLSNPTLTTLVKIAETLGVDLNSLVSKK